MALVDPRLLKCRSKWRLRDQAVIDVDANTLFVHPAFTFFRVIIKIGWIFLTSRCSLVLSMIGPKLVAKAIKQRVNTTLTRKGRRKRLTLCG